MIFIAGAVYFLQQIKITLPVLINNYLNDFLFVPIVLSLIQFIIRIFKRNRQFKIPTYTIFLIVIYYSIYFEFFLPKYKERYTSDLIDILMYTSGGIFFYLIENTCLIDKKTRS